MESWAELNKPSSYSSHTKALTERVLVMLPNDAAEPGRVEQQEHEDDTHVADAGAMGSVTARTFE